MADHDVVGVEHDIDGLEQKLRTAIEEIRNLGDGELLESVIEVIRLPGWTSIAEFVFATAMTEALIDHLVLARKMQGGLIAGARRVATEG